MSSGVKNSMNTMQQSQPNILLLMADQLRFDTLGTNGNPICHTPNLDRLAARGINFTRAYTPCSLCTPARASLFTGKYAFTHGMGTNCDMYHSLARELPDPEMLLHPRLQQVGYRCGYVGKWHIGTHKGPRDYGFDGMNVPGYGNLRKEPEFQRHLEEHGLSYTITPTMYGNANQQTLIGGVWEGPTSSTPAHYLALYTQQLLSAYANTEQPFFLTCQFWGPHMPHLPSREFFGKHDRNTIPPWPNFEEDVSTKPVSVQRMRTDFYRARPPTWDAWREIAGGYYDFMSMIDHEIGHILDHLECSGRADNTIVIFTTDHGDMTGSHNQLLDKGFLYEEAHHIPLMVSWPGRFVTDAVNDDLVSNMDIFPTLLDLLGVPDNSLDGRTFLPCLQGQANPGRRQDMLLEFHGLRYLYSQRALVTDDGWKYIFTPGDRDEVYNLKNDPAEMHNLCDEPSLQEQLETLRMRLIRSAQSAGDPIRDCIAKLFGHWEASESGQPDPTTI